MFLFEVLLHIFMVFCVITYVSCVVILTVNVINDWKEVLEKKRNG
jgi:hypothetical protein